ncbi:MAG: hypothetical protein JWM74_3441 [Myxococcaceae bacterium]|nr:hypothetical protein [Myxococcaceae bacterium]
MASKRVHAPLSPDSTVEELAKSELLDKLNGVSMAIYLRLVAASKARGRSMQITNKELLPGRCVANRSVQRSLDELIEEKLVRVKHKSGRNGGHISRTIELL